MDWSQLPEQIATNHQREFDDELIITPHTPPIRQADRIQ